MYENDATLKSSWTNGIIGAAIITVVGLALRLVLWYFKIELDYDRVTLQFSNNSFLLLTVSILIPVIASLVSYKGYMNLAAHNPSKLHLVAAGAFGRPWILSLILTVVLEIIWIVVCVVVLVIACELDLQYFEDDKAITMLFVGISGLGLVADVATFLLSNALFKPNTVMGYRN